jgi:N-acetylmuramoyl-L-alanine amidase
MDIQWIGSPNRRKGRNGFRPEAIVVHIMDGTLTGTDAWFGSPESGVSAHFGVGRKGEVHQYVGEADAAFHAGNVIGPTWALLKHGVNPNDYTIGIEHEGKAATAWTERMYRSSAELIKDLCHRWNIPLDRDHIVGHREIRADKSCPGTAVDLDRLVELARANALDPDTFNFVPAEGRVTTRTGLNIREGAPNTTAAIVRTARAGTVLAHVGWTSTGANVNGNPHWYRDERGNYF